MVPRKNEEKVRSEAVQPVAQPLGGRRDHRREERNGALRVRSMRGEDSLEEEVG